MGKVHAEGEVEGTTLISCISTMIADGEVVQESFCRTRAPEQLCLWHHLSVLMSSLSSFKFKNVEKIQF